MKFQKVFVLSVHGVKKLSTYIKGLYMAKSPNSVSGPGLVKSISTPEEFTEKGLGNTAWQARLYYLVDFL